LGVSQQTSSNGWYIDDVVLSAAVSQENLPPTIISPAQADEALVEGQSVKLSVQADDDTGESALVYTWSANDEFEYPVQYSENATNSASQTTATFAKAGIYHFQVLVRDPDGLTASSGVEVEVVPVLSSIQLDPETAELEGGESLEFVVNLRDQFNHAMEISEESVDWEAEGGQIDSSGLFTAGYVDGEYTVMANVATFSAEATVTVQGLFPAGAMLEMQLDSIAQETITLSIPQGMPAGTYLLEWSTTLAAGSWQVLDSYEIAETGEPTAIVLELPGEGFLRLRFESAP
jgi:hypothetical protein